ncbi:MAG: shikimate dehydrogenase [Gammaproteobacteria bacterium]|nr:shikimate dehydrogenase [Gammaproteobacteria bacterium]
MDQDRIEGVTRYAVVGDPVAHSQSPRIHTLFAEQTGEELIYTKQRVTVDEFTQFVGSFFAENGGGLNVTLPHKETAFELADGHSRRSKLARAANTLWLGDDGSLQADNTDGAGLVHDLSINNRITLTNRKLLVLGAGGAARGALASLVECGLSSITVLNRTLARATALKADFAAVYPINVQDFTSARLSPHDIIINATSMSLSGYIPPLDPDLLSDHCCCYDMMYSPKPTAFMDWAKRHGAGKVFDGIGMLVEQAAESFFVWRGVRPETADVIATLQRVSA